MLCLVVDRRETVSDMAIACGLILIALVALMWALCWFDPFDD